MSNEKMIVTMTREELCEVTKEAVKQAMAELNHKRQPPERLYTRSQAARLIGKQYNTIARMIASGRISTSADGRYISQAEIDRYTASVRE